LIMLLGHGDGTFQTPVSYVVGMWPGSVGVVPLDDGNTFLVTADGHTGSLWFTQVSPQGAIGAPAPTLVGGNPTGVAVADLTGGGQPDAVITGASSDVAVLLSQGGEFTAFSSYSLGQPSPKPEAIAIGDLNGDGKPDLIVANAGTTSGSVSTLLGKGDGTFQPPASTPLPHINALSLALGDFNGDGKLDAAVAAYGTLPGYTGSDTGGIEVLLGNGDGTFQTPVSLTLSGLQPKAVAAGDLSGNGILDLAVVLDAGASALQPGPGTLAVFLGQPGGKFQAARTWALQSTSWGAGGGIAIGDFNRDGKLDIAATGGNGGPIDILLGDGAGNFHEAASLPTSIEPFASGLLVTDVDGDGKLDLVISHCCGQTEATYFPGNGDGTFQGEQPLLSGSSPTALAATTFNGNTGLVFVDNPSAGGANRNAPSSMVAVEVAPLSTGSGSSLTIAANGSAASSKITALAPASIATMYGTNLATATGSPTTSTLPTSLKGTTVTIADSSGAQQTAPLFYVSPGQVNYLVPAGTALGEAVVTVTNSTGVVGATTSQIANSAPGIFELNASGLAAAVVLIVAPDGSQSFQNIYQVNSSNAIVALPINLSAGQVYLELYGTGIRNAKDVTVQVGGLSVPVLSSSAQGTFLGLDQVNIGPLPQSLKGKGQTNIALTADGQAAEVVNVAFK
jgi:uncharacterized protein (TIGR03437 family)